MTNEVIDNGPRSGLEVIHRYERAQAIAAGVLVDVSEPAKRCGFRVPVAMSAALARDCKTWGDDAAWRLLNFACETIRAAKHARTEPLALWLGAFARRGGRADICVGRGDDGEPVLTLMYPGDE